MDIKTMKAAVIDALEEIKAKNIVVLNVSKLTSLFDYLVVASGDSNRQTKALANNIKERLKEGGATVHGSEGEENGEWVLVDLGDIVVHVMQPAIREYYRLEELWRDGKIEYPRPDAKKAAPKKLVKAGTVTEVKKNVKKAAPRPRGKAAAAPRGGAAAKPRTKAGTAKKIAGGTAKKSSTKAGAMVPAGAKKPASTPKRARTKA